MIPPGYKVVELNQRVVGVEPEFFSRFFSRAERKADKMNANRIAPVLFRFEVHREGGKWAVVAMQNQLQPE